jgi:hypothetical protein
VIIEATCHQCGAIVMVESKPVKCSHCGKEVCSGQYLDLPEGGHICVRCLVRRVWTRLVGFEIGFFPNGLEENDR